MTNDEIRIAVAELCGWNTNKQVLGGVFIYHDPKGNIAAALPNYPASLDACKDLISHIVDYGWGLTIVFYNDSVKVSIHVEEDGVSQTVLGTKDEAAYCLCQAFLELHHKWKSPTIPNDN